VERKVHYVMGDQRYTLCGLSEDRVQVTHDPREVTCTSCRTHPALDSAFGSMTHTGH
jgi:hypothetical protein